MGLSGPRRAHGLYALLAYRRLKRSTRPSVSMSFCLPEKNGWQAPQISSRTSSWVERVWKVLPQAHTTVTMCRVGWMSFFTFRSFSPGLLYRVDFRLRERGSLADEGCSGKGVLRQGLQQGGHGANSVD